MSRPFRHEANTNTLELLSLDSPDCEDELLEDLEENSVDSVEAEGRIDEELFELFELWELTELDWEKVLWDDKSTHERETTVSENGAEFKILILPTLENGGSISEISITSSELRPMPFANAIDGLPEMASATS